jgi:RNA polymerase sigma-70 factor, ECF subfamily
MTQDRFRDYTDEQLMDGYIRSGDPQFAEALYLRFYHLVFGLCYRYLKDEERAKDAVMHLFEQLLAKPPQDPIRQVRSWLYTVAKNHCLVLLRSDRSARRYETFALQKLHEAVMENTEGVFPLEGEDHQVREQAVHQAMEQLKEKQKRCITLFYLGDLSYEEVSKQTGYPMNKVKSYIQNGKRNLKNLLSDV